MPEANVVSITKWRHTNHELWRYMEATRRISAKETSFRVCGRDQTKIGTDIAINSGMLMMQSTGLTAVMPPQVIPAVGMKNMKLQQMV